MGLYTHLSLQLRLWEHLLVAGCYHLPLVVVVDTALSSGPCIGLAILTYFQGRCVCPTRPSTNLAHLSAR
jgi:hypothetical protein